MIKPFFSIVIPAYNRLKELKRAIESCKKQTFTDYEIVVVDDCSSVDLSVILEEFQDIKYIRAPNNVGGGGARNIGIKASEGEYIAFLDSDDEFHPDKLLIVSQYILKNQKKSSNTLFYSKVMIDRGVSAFIERPSYGINEGEDPLEYIFVKWGLITTSTIVLPSEIARNVLFDSELKRHQDYDFVLRCNLENVFFHFIPTALVTNHDVTDAGRITQSTGYEHSIFWYNKVSEKMTDKSKIAFKARVLAGMHPRFYKRIIFVLASFVSKAGISKRDHLNIFIKAISPKFYSWLCTIYVTHFGSKN